MKRKTVWLSTIRACPLQTLAADHYNDDQTCKCRELAGRHWDDVLAPDELDETTSGLREQYIRNALARPYVMAELVELYRGKDTL